MDMANAKNMRVLILDDDLVNMRTISNLLKRNFGFKEVATSTNINTVLKSVRDTDSLYDLIICNLYMANMDGREFVASLSENGYGGQIMLIKGGGAGYAAEAEEMARECGLKVAATINKPATLYKFQEVFG